MTRNIASFANRPMIVLIAIGCLGCSLEEDTLKQALDQAQSTTSAQKTFFTGLDVDGGRGEAAFVESSEGELASQNPPLSDAIVADQELAARPPSVPFPDRTNPFEFGEGIDFDAPQTRQNEVLDIKLFGFVGSEQPKAIVSVDGRTKALQAGEKWGVLEILDVTPPTVRIKSNGVVRVWSLLGHHNQTNR